MKMEYQDFREDDVFSMTGKTTIWSERLIPVNLQLGEERGKREQVLRYIDAINAQLEWITQNRAVITDMLVKDGLLTLAEDWISGAEDISEYDENEEPIKEIYRLEDGTEYLAFKTNDPVGLAKDRSGRLNPLEKPNLLHVKNKILASA